MIINISNVKEKLWLNTVWIRRSNSKTALYTEHRLFYFLKVIYMHTCIYTSTHVLPQFCPSPALASLQHTDKYIYTHKAHTRDTHKHTWTCTQLQRGKSSKIINLSHQSLLLILPQQSTATWEAYSVFKNKSNSIIKC